ncbi:MAG: hypothetical protein JOZ10_09485 [Acidobacteria bacterium]|nr:hypothetical protein [Acidobacteriota bacterium]
MLKRLSIALLVGVAPWMVSCGGTATTSVQSSSQQNPPALGAGGTGTTTGSGSTVSAASGCDSNSLLWGGNKSAATGTGNSKFVPTGVMTQPRAGHSATLLANGKVLIVDGGQLDIDDLLVSIVSAELFDPSTGTFSPTGTPCIAREFHTATLLSNGKVLIAGGNGFDGYPTWLTPTATAELYDPASSTFSNTGSMAVGRTCHTATLLPDGRVLITGGSANSGTGASTSTVTLASVEIYDPGTGKFAVDGNMGSPREGHTATLLPSGDVLIIGGQNEQGALATAELYHPASNSFTTIGKMATPRVGHTATLLPDGSVLITGGAATPALGVAQMVIGSTGQMSAEIYDPASGSFAPAGPMSTGRTGHTAVILSDGTVLVAGGFKDWNSSTGYESYNTAEIYDPKSRSFTPTDPLNTGRFWHTATMLPDGSVLVAGGIGSDQPQASAEIFH